MPVSIISMSRPCRTAHRWDRSKISDGSGLSLGRVGPSPPRRTVILLISDIQSTAAGHAAKNLGFTMASQGRMMIMYRLPRVVPAGRRSCHQALNESSWRKVISPFSRIFPDEAGFFVSLAACHGRQ